MLDISLLGSPLITLDGRSVTGFVSQKSLALFAYLAVESKQPHARTALADMFWPGQISKVALKNLRDVLSNLQKLLGNQTAVPPYLLITRQTVQFNPDSSHTLDTRQFASLLTTCESHRHKKIETCRTCAQRLQQAIELYRSDFLADVFVDDSAAFEHWLVLNRERRQQLALEALNHLTRFHARRQEFSAARRYALRQVEIAPWLEVAYRQLMALSALMGQRGAALTHFETCRRRLAQELDVPPGSETMALYEQIKMGERPSTPSLPIITLPPHHIPAQTTAFLGREQEQLAIADYLQNPQCRLLTLIGSGGSGKTRLAVQVAGDEFANFEHGVFFVPLTAVDSTANLLITLAESINLPLAGQKPPQEQLLNYLREKELLLVLDNFESVLGDAAAPALLADILQYAPRVVMLVTSRQPVGLQAERLFNLDGLPYPDASSQADFERWDAVQLYLDRARRIQPDVAADRDNLAAIAAICQLIEGLPLGIELAAAWAREMSGVEILTAVQTSLDTLATTRPDVPPRHRSLRATFASSWALLTAAEQRAFCALSVFRGGFTAEAAPVEAPVLSALVGKSLLRLDEDGRYQIHELLRQFGEEKLAEDPHAETGARDYHSAWVVGFLQKWEPHLQSGQQLKALAHIRNEIDNVRAGWHWTLARRNEAEIAQAMPAIAQFLDLRGWFQEGAELFGGATAVIRDLGVLNGRLLAYHASFTYRLGDYESAQVLFEQSLTVFDQLAAPHEAAFAHNGLASIAVNRGQYAAAQEHAKLGLAVTCQTKDDYEQAKSLDILGIVARYEGRLPDAKTHFQASLQIYQRLGNQFGLARCLNYLGNVALSEGDYEEAQVLLTQAMASSRAINYRFLMAYLFNNLGNTTSHLQQYPAAKAYFEEGLQQFQNLGDQFGMAMAQLNLGQIHVLMGNHLEAQQWFLAAIQGGLAMKSLALVTGALSGTAVLFSKIGQAMQALELATFVLHHPAAREETKEEAGSLAAELLASLPEKQAAAAQSRSETLSMTDAVNIITQPLPLTHS
ncbi:MAG: tetratricopeptide repeat protein [Ardenticatenaceae bacterium]|nr:tetratricopeptide repeat protein [Ardenticatenaceae bacterium]MCB9004525.1 tetratricopeptide repeat protein [Ardenticatenaceae bacterium]